MIIPPIVGVPVFFKGLQFFSFRLPHLLIFVKKEWTIGPKTALTTNDIITGITTWYDICFSTSCIFFSHADSCVFSNFSSIRYFLLLCKISHTILFPGTSLFLLNFKVWKHIFKYFFHDRCCYGSSIIYALWVIVMTSPSTFGLSAGANPKKDAIYLFALLGSVWEVAVFPPIETPLIAAFFPVPSLTTFSKSIRTVSLVFSLTIPSVVSYLNVLTFFPFSSVT